jgi:hypothetical protein
VASPNQAQVTLKVEAFRIFLVEIVNHKIYLPNGLEN